MSRSKIGMVFYRWLGENKSVEMCYLDDEAVAMSLLLVPA